MKRLVSLILVSLLFVSVLSVSLISASFLGSWFDEFSNNKITGSVVSNIIQSPVQKTCEQTRILKKQTNLNRCVELETKTNVKSYWSCSISSGGRPRCGTYYDYNCVKTTQTACSQTAACPAGSIEKSSVACERCETPNQCTDSNGGYCNDKNAIISVSSNQEICSDGKDNNCNGKTDEGCTLVNTPDYDADGYPSIISGGNDCNDKDASINPGATESCDGFDNNCDGQIDEGCSNTGTGDNSNGDTGDNTAGD